MHKKRLRRESVLSFKRKIWRYYRKEGRSLTWRRTKDPYKIVVSEIMLQQTQVDRVKEKYKEFIRRFPTFKKLSQARFKSVLKTWQGLGYNRRARYLQQIAQKVTRECKGRLPHDSEVLETFPGIGEATACSIVTFACNKPTVFIETNIRTVFIHEFFKNKKSVGDKDIVPLVKQTLPSKNYREWYYALMDYGVMLKKKYPNPSRKSTHHTKQTPFKGSDREIRGIILKLLTHKNILSKKQVITKVDKDPKRIEKILTDLEREKFIKREKSRYTIDK